MRRASLLLVAVAASLSTVACGSRVDPGAAPVVPSGLTVKVKTQPPACITGTTTTTQTETTTQTTTATGPVTNV